MSKFCENEIARKLMFENAEITENILKDSKVAINAMKESSRTEIVYVKTTLPVNSNSTLNLYNEKAFVFSISQNLNNSGPKTTIHGNYIIGNKLMTTLTSETYGTDAKKYIVNKFVSSVQQQACYYSGDPKIYSSYYSYAYIFKI